MGLQRVGPFKLGISKGDIDPMSIWNTCVHTKSFQQGPTLCDTRDYSPSGSSVHGFSRQEYWSGLPYPFLLQGIFLTQGLKPCLLVSCISRQVLYHYCHLGCPPAKPITLAGAHKNCFGQTWVTSLLLEQGVEIVLPKLQGQRMNLGRLAKIKRWFLSRQMQQMLTASYYRTEDIVGVLTHVSSCVSVRRQKLPYLF